MKTKNILMIVFIASALTLLVCCAVSPPPKLEPIPITVTYEMPTLKALENYPELQEKEGIAISVVPIGFNTVKRFNRKCEWQPRLLQVLLKEEELKPDLEYDYKVTETPYYEVKPDELIFNIKIYNHLDHVVRLAGTVVSFKVDGKMMNIDKANYQEFIEGFIIPRQEEGYKIVGPPISQLPKQCNIALLLYDIVTETDAAGNPTKRSNFEWFFSYAKETKEEPDKVNIKKESMTPREAKLLEMRKW